MLVDEPPRVLMRPVAQATRFALRVVAPLACIGWVGFALVLFAHRVAPYTEDVGCLTAGSTGTIWAIGELLTAVVGLAAALVFAAVGRRDSRPGDVAFAILLTALLVWVVLVERIPAAHSCR